MMHLLFHDGVGFNGFMELKQNLFARPGYEYLRSKCSGKSMENFTSDTLESRLPCFAVVRKSR